MVVEEDDPNWPLDADVGWGNGASEYFEHHAIKTVVGEDGSEIDWEGEIDDSWGNSQLEDFERAREGNPGISECQGPIAISGSQTGYQVLREIWHMLLKSGNAPRSLHGLVNHPCVDLIRDFICFKAGNPQASSLLKMIDTCTKR
ncbi:hypothetical protein V6N13_002780 [Hibiscus sabdariffa]